MSRFSRDIATRAGPVLDDDWLLKSLRHSFGNQARNEVKISAGREADDDAHRAGTDRFAAHAMRDMAGKAPTQAARCKNWRR